MLASRIDAVAKVLIRAGLATIKEMREMQMAAQAMLPEAFVAEPQGLARTRGAT